MDKPVYSRSCFECGIYKRLGCFPVPPRVPSGKIEFLIIGEAPGRTEIKEREPFCGKVGLPFRRAMEMSSVPLDATILTNAAWCPPPGNEPGSIATPSADEARTCLVHSFDLVWRHRPAVIYLVGGVAFKSVCGSQRTISKEDGNLYRLSDFLRGLPTEVRYGAFRSWVELHPESGEVAAFDPILEPAAAELQMELAEAKWRWGLLDGYNPCLVPTLHPSFAERQGGFGNTNLMSPEWTRIKASLARGVAAIRETGRIEKRYRRIATIEALDAYVNETIAMHAAGVVEFIAVDIETSEEYPVDEIFKIPFAPETRVLTVQVTREPDEGVMILVNHRDSAHNNPAATRILTHHLGRLLGAVPAIGHNFSFDYLTMRNKLGLKGYRVVGDTLLADHWLNMGLNLPAGLEDVEQRYVGGGHKYESRGWRQNNPGKTFEDMPAELQLYYAVGDSDGTFRSFLEIRKRLRAEGRWDAYVDLYFGSHGVWRYVVDLMWAGMPVDKPALDRLLIEFPPKVAAEEEALNRTTVVQACLRRRFDAEMAEARKYNAELASAGDKRKKRRHVYETFESWYGDPDNRYNANSNKQTDELFALLNLGAVAASISDLHFKDDGKGLRADENNRILFAQFYSQLANQIEGFIAKLVVKDEASGQEMCRPEHVTAIADARSHLAMAKDRADFFTRFNTTKSINKTYGTYVAGIPDITADKFGDDNLPADDRLFPCYRGLGDPPLSWLLHPSVKLQGTDTGRPSTEAPNCQNYPKRKAEKVLGVTDIYVSRHRRRGGVLLASDLSQIEVRVLVCDANEEAMAAAMNAGEDIHTWNAARRHKIPKEKVTKELRTPIKETTFGVIYGQSTVSIARRLHIPLEDAESIQKGLFDLMPGVVRHISAQHAFVKQHGYVENRFGRRRQIPQVRSDDRALVNEALRQAVNAPIQGTASDMCLSASGRSWRVMQEWGVPVLPFNIIHDANYWDCAPGSFFDALEIVYYQMAIRPQQLWPWCIVKPETEFDLGTNFGAGMCEAKLVWSGGELDHNTLELRAKRPALDALCATLEVAGGLTVLGEGPHPNAEEAKKGYMHRVIFVERPNPRAQIIGGRLVGPGGRECAV